MEGKISGTDGFKPGMKDWGNHRWWEWKLGHWSLWWGDVCRMRWTGRRVNRMGLTEWRRELIPLPPLVR